MDRIINWYILVIIFVFDPLAIALVVAANFAFAQLTRRVETPLEEKVEDMRNVVEAYDGLQDEIKQYEIYKEKDKEYYQKNNLDLNRDGVVEEEELQQVFDAADINDDGYIDEHEAKLANLDPETTNKLNQLNKQVEGVVDNVKQYYNFNPEELSQINNQIEEIKKLSMELGSLKNKKDDNTITYF
jgi:uncharacterized protein YlxW (UPF0749 family)